MNTSVIIPTYYRSYDVYRLFESLLAQFVQPSEILVIDDTPTAEIKSLCEEYATEFKRRGVAFTYLKKRRDQRSIAISRNLGVKMAHGDILIFIDSDMMPFPDYVETVLHTFNKYPGVLGVGGWHPTSEKSARVKVGFRYYSLQIFLRIFALMHDSRNSCKILEYPVALSDTICCQYLLGGTMSFRSKVFDEFQFDENLKAYSLGEDYLLSIQIFKKYPNSLLLSPDARCINTSGQEGRPNEKEYFDIKIRNGKYILTKLWGFKGLLLFGRQYMGLVILKTIERIERKHCG